MRLWVSYIFNRNDHKYIFSAMFVNFLILTKNVKCGIIWKKIIVSQFYYHFLTPCVLETYTGNIVGWKHELRLETCIADWNSLLEAMHWKLWTIRRLCFQSNSCVSNMHVFVSNFKSCFQATKFPINMKFFTQSLRWLKIKEIYTVFPISITQFSNHLK